MKATRRRFFALAGSAPIAAKAAADKAVAALCSVEGIQGGLVGPNWGVPACGVGTSPSPEQFRLALSIPSVLRQAESLLYEQERVVSRIDYDLAACRSFSLAAKITYQRQRNVAKRLEMAQESYSWDRLSDMVRKAIGL